MSHHSLLGTHLEGCVWPEGKERQGKQLGQHGKRLEGQASNTNGGKPFLGGETFRVSFFFRFGYVCMCGHIYATTLTMESREHGITFLSPPSCGSQGLNSGPWACAASSFTHRAVLLAQLGLYNFLGQIPSLPPPLHDPNELYSAFRMRSSGSTGVYSPHMAQHSPSLLRPGRTYLALL